MLNTSLDGSVTNSVTSETAVAPSTDAAPSGAEASGEPVAAPAEAQKKHDLDYASRFNALARRERALQQKEAETRAMMKEYSSLKNLKETVKQNPTKLFEEYGITYDDMTNALLNDGKPTTDMSLKEIKEEFQKLKEEIQQKEQLKEKQNTDNSIKAYKNSVSQYVKNNDSYEYIQHEGSYALDLIYDTALEYVRKTGSEISHQQVCDAVEAYFEEEYSKPTKFKKFQAKFGPKTELPSEPTAQSTAQAKQESHGRQPSPTLTNSMGARTHTAPAGIKSEAESITQASGTLRWIK